MSIKMVEGGLLIEGDGVIILITDEQFDPVFWAALLWAIREGVIYG